MAKSKKKNVYLYGVGEELNWGEVTAEVADDIINDGLTSDTLDEILAESECGITDDFSIQVDQYQIDINSSKVLNEAKIRTYGAGSPGSSFLIQRLELKGLFHQFEIRGDFDLAKLKAVTESYELGSTGHQFKVTRFNYDGQENIEDFDFS